MVETRKVRHPVQLKRLVPAAIDDLSPDQVQETCLYAKEVSASELVVEPLSIKMAARWNDFPYNIATSRLNLLAFDRWGETLLICWIDIGFRSQLQTECTNDKTTRECSPTISAWSPYYSMTLNSQS